MDSAIFGLAGVQCSAATYTVISKSGQRGLEFHDPALAAQAFARACARDRPFVLRHHGRSSIVIASSKAGKKSIEPSGADDRFRLAYEWAADNFFQTTEER